LLVPQEALLLRWHQVRTWIQLLLQQDGVLALRLPAVSRTGPVPGMVAAAAAEAALLPAAGTAATLASISFSAAMAMGKLARGAMHHHSVRML
jgi:hypothetical protein